MLCLSIVKDAFCTAKLLTGNPFPPRGSPLTSINNNGDGLGQSGKGKVKEEQIGPVSPFPPRGSPLTSKIVWR